MVAGHLTLKNGKYYAVLNYKTPEGSEKRNGSRWDFPKREISAKPSQNWQGSERNLSRPKKWAT